MIRIALLLMLSGVFSAATVAQSIPKTGYVVAAQGDTLRGAVLLQSAARNARECRFRASGDATEQVLTPNRLRGYGANGLHFESLNTPGDTVRVFLRRVVTPGPVQLLYRRDANTDRYFIRRRGQTRLTELIYQEKEILRGATTYRVRTRQYQDTLALIFQDCPKVATQVRQVRFEINPLSRLVQRYNACQGGAQESTKGGRNQLSLGVVAATALYDRLLFGNNTGASPLNQTYRGVAFTTVGLALSVRPGFEQSPITVQTGVQLELNRRFSAQAPFFKAEFGADYVVVPAVLRYTYPRLSRYVQPYVEAGGSLRYLMRVRRDFLTYGSTPLDFIGPNFVELGGGAVGGVGLTIGTAQGRRASVGLRGEIATTPSPSTGSSGMRSWHMQLILFPFGNQ